MTREPRYTYTTSDGIRWRHDLDTGQMQRADVVPYDQRDGDHDPDG